MERWGRLDVLCANAGIFPQAKLEEMTEADFERVMNVNVKGTFLSVQAAIPVMKKQGYGRIVLTSSITGPITGYPAGRTTGRPRPHSSASCARPRSNSLPTGSR